MNADESASDKRLLDRFRSGHDDAATQLYLRYAGRLRALAAQRTATDLKSRVDPEDIVQSVFRTFFRRVSRGEYSVPEGEELWKLFLVIALNKVRATGAFHHAKMRDTRNTAGGSIVEEAASRSNDDESLATLQLTINDLLQAMPETSREVISLRIEGHDVNTIAERTGRAKRSIERVLQEFRKALNQELEKGI